MNTFGACHFVLLLRTQMSSPSQCAYVHVYVHVYAHACVLTVVPLTPLSTHVPANMHLDMRPYTHAYAATIRPLAPCTPTCIAT